MTKKRIELKWSKNQRDWMFSYPDNEGCSIMCVFFDMLKVSEHRVTWDEDLKKMLEDRGYDYKTLKITVDKKCDENNM